jgi:hypothetical protein
MKSIFEVCMPTFTLEQRKLDTNMVMMVIDHVLHAGNKIAAIENLGATEVSTALRSEQANCTTLLCKVADTLAY